jgi:hypothetical protein
MRTCCGQRNCILMNVPSAGRAAKAATANDCQCHCTYFLNVKNDLLKNSNLGKFIEKLFLGIRATVF